LKSDIKRTCHVARNRTAMKVKRFFGVKIRISSGISFQKVKNFVRGQSFKELRMSLS
jgi:hypothetical protein